mmetsp:Transcript_11450/g.28952  ORF Transcript_11450/g.28952 Transcript_11450/m.28952 type:complete len:798 (+) Transcript_11450:93-2486(+)
MDAGALDDLDLDDMFAEDGDMLFEGLDITLDDTMGDMIASQNNKDITMGLPPVIEPVAPPGPKTKRPGGPRTKRTNPMLEKAKAKEEAPTGPGNKRRKTKRKSKAPAAFRDDEDDPIEDLEPPKKRRKATTKTKKADVVIATTKTKRRKKSDVLATSTIKSTIGTTGVARALPISSVAAAGQFGGRLKKTKVKRKLKKSSTDSSAENIAAAPLVLIKPPKPEPTFGGLHPSSTFFYPFLESVPMESTMQKRKTYPIMDRVSSTLTSQLLSYAPKPQDTNSLGVTEDSAIFKLMLDTYEGSEKDKKNFTSDKRAALLRGISHLRKMVHKADKNNLVKDVFAMCGLLTREYNFLKQTLDNMKSWCKNEFDDDKYKETYEPPIEQPKITKWKCNTGIVKIKVVCTGFKEPKASMPLIAMLPAIVFDPTSTRLSLSSNAAATAKALATIDLKKSVSMASATIIGAKAGASTLTKKKRKDKATERPKTKATSSQVPSSPVPKTYAEMTPLARRQQIVERVSQLALELESSLQKEKIVGRLDPVPEEQPPLHTTRMWNWLQAAGFYNKDASSKFLASIKSPKMHSRGPFQSIPRSIQGRDANLVKEGEQRVSSVSLFNRLQSLLVEVVSENESDHDEDDSDEESLSFLDDDDDDLDDDFQAKVKAFEEGEMSKKPKFDIADLSELSLEERAFIHLSKAGLIKKSLYPSVNLVLSNVEKEENETEDLGDVIEAMSTDLTRMTSTNNARISFIERLTSDADVYYNKQVEEEQAVLIAKCQNLMKRTKEKAKKAKQKKDENLNLPW